MESQRGCHNRDLRVLIDRRDIHRRTAEIAGNISSHYPGQSVLLIGVLKGAAFFLSDLARALSIDASFDFIALSSYGQASKSRGVVRLIKDIEVDVHDRNVIIVEDILDTGLTLQYLKNLLLARHPADLKTAVLLDKPSRRVFPMSADYTGFAIDDVFVVGYGMDFGERYRNLPDICVLEGCYENNEAPPTPLDEPDRT